MLAPLKGPLAFEGLAIANTSPEEWELLNLQWEQTAATTTEQTLLEQAAPNRRDLHKKGKGET